MVGWSGTVVSVEEGLEDVVDVVVIDSSVTSWGPQAVATNAIPTTSMDARRMTNPSQLLCAQCVDGRSRHRNERVTIL